MANLALHAARLAGQHIARAYDRPDLIKVATKGRNDYVTNVDREAERIIVKFLQGKYPDHRYIGEEGMVENTEASVASDYEWFIDPIDGTSNFVHGVPHFCVSIGCLQQGKLAHGVILDPIRREEFVASRGQGCRFNGLKVRTRHAKGLAGAMIAMNLSIKQLGIYKQLVAADAIMRQSGSTALDLAYVAAGKIDATWSTNLRLWDMVAGVLMVTEAGGFVGDFLGGIHHLKSGNLIAGTPKVFKTLTPLFKAITEDNSTAMRES